MSKKIIRSNEGHKRGDRRHKFLDSRRVRHANDGLRAWNTRDSKMIHFCPTLLQRGDGTLPEQAAFENGPLSELAKKSVPPAFMSSPKARVCFLPALRFPRAKGARTIRPAEDSQRTDSTTHECPDEMRPRRAWISMGRRTGDGFSCTFPRPDPPAPALGPSHARV